MTSSLAPVLFRRLRTVYIDHAGPRPGDAPTDEGLVALEAELLDRGFVPTGPLRSALAWLGPTGLAEAGKDLLRLIDAELGADRTHMPLFRSFPVSVPDDTFGLYVDRVFTILLQWPDQPCVLCGTNGSVQAVSPCAHLVCRACWDGADYSGCPICHRRTDPADPFLKPAPPARPVETPGGPLQPLTRGVDAAADAARALQRLLARRTPLPPQDRDDVKVLLAHAPPALDWLPDAIPVRETKALVMGTLLLDRRTREAARPLLTERLTTATDVLRLLAVWSGGEADLLDERPFRSLPRALRRTLLTILDGLDTASLVEDLLRHPARWKRAAEILHPYEQYGRHPRAALAFAVLRATDTSAGPLGDALLRTAAEHPRAVRVDGNRIKANTWPGRVEQALAGRDPDAAVALLARRPGELLRRLDHVLRSCPGGVPSPALKRALESGLAKAGPGPLLASLGRLRTRHVPGERRVFFPRGQVTHSYTTDDTRAPLPSATVAEVCALLEREVLRRLGDGEAERYDIAVLDEALAGLAVPSAEGAAAKALVSVPRGSTQPLPAGAVLRMFLHWTEPAKTRVDLDLSVALFDADWEYVGLCDFTHLVYGKRAAVHSGDLTSAPAPHGATEYADLDLAGLSAAGVRFAMPIVFSFNNIPFEQLLDAFAGFMALPSADERDEVSEVSEVGEGGGRGARSARYDPRTVRQRYDLVGESRIHVPMLVDLQRRTFLWTDLHLPSSEGFHRVYRHSADLGRVGKDLHQYFTAGRTTLWDLAVWHASAGAPTVAVLREHEVWRYERGPGEDVALFAARIRTLAAPDAVEPADPQGPVGVGRRVFLALVEGDFAPVQASGTVYRLLPGPVDGCGLDQMTAGDLVAALG
ncbi:MXAN_6230/SCO0854 family RING domain-containing protein [Streptomyces hiroshimensis]|uniref:MXAN_6230/SCO0854 family RING domain-containing protein n=1 Tax=Streptomyces hiroshimensis TaxID=66424 RepID=UPI001674B5AD|nr:MXAN_6230/SCO0854 family RING domain-containing protein [Streptomyces hiroshimensis]